MFHFVVLHYFNKVFISLLLRPFRPNTSSSKKGVYRVPGTVS